MNDCSFHNATPANGIPGGRRWAATLAGCLLILSACHYGKVSGEAYDFATALYSIANRKAAGKLPEIRAQLDEAASAGTVSDQEAEWLRAIMEDAERANWDRAAKAARQILEDQVNRSG